MWRVVFLDEQYYVMDVVDEEKIGPFETKAQANEAFYMLRIAGEI